jgi:hypothetical protein
VAPEQIEGKPVDQRSNIYSLGALYYFLLAGRPPYTGDTEQVHRAHLSGTPPSLSELAPIPTHVEALVLKALERSSSKRFMTLRQLLGELESVVEGRDPATTQPLGRAGDASFAVAGLGKADKDVPATLLGVPAFKASERPLKSDTVPSPSPPSIVVASDVMVEPRVAVAAPDAWKDDTAPAPSIDPQARISTSVERPAFGKDKDRKKKKKADKAKASKTKFRETMWFKKGELDEAAAEAAARQKSADAVMDRADQMPMEDRYADDGSLTEQDRERLSLRTGGTQAMGAVRDIPVGEVSEEELASELAGGRTRLIAAVAAIALVVIIIVIIAAT